MDNSRYNESYVYRYINRMNGMTYFGARWGYSKDSNNSAIDDFGKTYISSSCSELFWKDYEEGLLDGEIISIFNKNNLPIKVSYKDESFMINDLKTLALYVEDNLISSFWNKVGKKFSYNKVRNFDKDCSFYRPENRTEYYMSAKCKEVARINMRIMQSKGTNRASREKANATNRANHNGELSMHLPENRQKQMESDRNNHGGVRAWDLPDSIARRTKTFMENNDPTEWLNTDEAIRKRLSKYLYYNPDKDEYVLYDRANGAKLLDSSWIMLREATEEDINTHSKLKIRNKNGVRQLYEYKDENGNTHVYSYPGRIKKYHPNWIYIGPYIRDSDQVSS